MVKIQLNLTNTPLTVMILKGAHLLIFVFFLTHPYLKSKNHQKFTIFLEDDCHVDLDQPKFWMAMTHRSIMTHQVRWRHENQWHQHQKFVMSKSVKVAETSKREADSQVQKNSKGHQPIRRHKWLHWPMGNQKLK